MSDAPHHIPVLLDEVVSALAPSPGELMVDATFGAGGYTRALLARGARVIAFDRDPDAIRAGRESIADGLTLVEGEFSRLEDGVAEPIDFAGNAALRGRLPNTAARTWTAGLGAAVITESMKP